MPDTTDGTYRNPVLFADYSDPDAIRVGDDYWLTASSFCHVPGLPILHSRDLVNWTLVNHALPRLTPIDHFSKPRHGCGVWASSLRYHAGKYWIFYPDPDFGLYVITADHPAGAWSEPTLVLGGKGLIDPCPLWDDDGSAYLIHGWAKSRAGIKNRLTLHRLAPDSRSVVDGGQLVVDGDKMEGWHTIEGPKLYKRNGYYYIFAPAGGVRDGYQAVFRARNIYGPYDHRIVLAQGSTPINGPHQGAWVDTPTGEHGFLHFQERAPFGRIVHLQPMAWRDDWPEMGRNVDRNGVGEPVLVAPKPRVSHRATTSKLVPPATVHETPSREWQWQANPQPGWFSPTPDASTWRLACVPLSPTETLWQASHLLMRKFVGPAFVATTSLRLYGMADGDRAGLVIFGHDYAWLGLRWENQSLRLGLHVCLKASESGAEVCVEQSSFVGAQVFLHVHVNDLGLCQFSFSLDGIRYHLIGEPFQAKLSVWVGAKVGVFAASTTAAPTASATAYAEFSGFSFDVLSTSEAQHNTTATEASI